MSAKCSAGGKKKRSELCCENEGYCVMIQFFDWSVVLNFDAVHYLIFIYGAGMSLISLLKLYMFLRCSKFYVLCIGGRGGGSMI